MVDYPVFASFPFSFRRHPWKPFNKDGRQYHSLFRHHMTWTLRRYQPTQAAVAKNPYRRRQAPMHPRCHREQTLLLISSAATMSQPLMRCTTDMIVVFSAQYGERHWSVAFKPRKCQLGNETAHTSSAK